MRQQNLFLCLVMTSLLYPLQAQYILTVNFENMDSYIGLRSEVRITDISNGKEVGRKIFPSVESAAFSTELYVLLQGHSYNVDMYADVNANGTYDPPPADHAWRRTVNFVTMDTEVNFVPDDSYTNVNIENPYPFSTYHAIWGGRWRNLTFGSTDTIQASLEATCDSIFASMKTSGVFGNPDTVRFDFADMLPDSAFDPASDSIVFNVPPPWTGEVHVINGDLHGDMSLMGTQLQFTGTVGATQILGHYTVLIGGNPFANGFFYIWELTATSTPELVVEGHINNVSCGGYSDGMILAEANGGNAGYHYAWSNGDTTSVITGLGPGDYIVTVTDELGCSVAATYSVTEPDTLRLIVFSSVPPTWCIGTCDGYVVLYAMGGQPPYDYLWSHGYTGPYPDNFCTGEYSVTVTDVTGCTVMETVTIGEPDSLVITDVLIEHASSGQHNGSLSVTVDGGTFIYVYSIDGVVFQDSPIFTDLPPGEYCVTIMDATGCKLKSEVYEILDITGVADLKVYFNIFPNPASKFVRIQADRPLSVELYDQLGNLVLTKDESVAHILKTEAFVAGLYLLQLSDGHGLACRKVIIE